MTLKNKQHQHKIFIFVINLTISYLETRFIISGFQRKQQTFKYKKRKYEDICILYYLCINRTNLKPKQTRVTTFYKLLNRKRTNNLLVINATEFNQSTQRYS